MARFHVLDRNGQEVNVAVHVLTPAGNNAAGIPWATAVKNSGKYGTTILLDGDGTAGTIDAAEKAQIVSGDVIEVIIQLRPQTSQEPLNQYFDGLFADTRQTTLDQMRDRLRHFGFIRGTN